MFKKSIAIISIGLFLVSLSGCKESPDNSIIKNKDMDNLIEEANNTENGVVNFEDVKGNYDSYVKTINDEELKVDVTIDAKVDIPNVTQLSVIRVETKKISQEMVDQVKEVLMPDQKLYEGAALYVMNKEDIEKELTVLKSEIQNTTDEVMIDEYQSRINDLEVEYENAPQKLIINEYPSDGQLHSVSEKYAKGDFNAYYEWQNSLNPNGTVLYAVNDGESEFNESLYVQNNDNYGNCLRYGKTKNNNGYEYISAVVIGDSDFPENNSYSDYWIKGDGISPMYDTGAVVTELKDESATISLEEAKIQANELIEKMGYNEFQFYEGGLYCEKMDIRDNDDFISRNIYILRYMRNINGAFITYDTTAKYTEGWSEDEYYKKIWCCESILIKVNDTGIVSVSIDAPLNILDTVVEKSNMKTFDEIKDIFEKMVTVKYAAVDGKSKILIDRVKLGYVRVSEEDSFNTGLLVPAWEFYGKVSKMDDDNNINEECVSSVMTINAIDGTIIDKSLGY